jgi:PAS domain S-box-containing protein
MKNNITIENHERRFELLVSGINDYALYMLNLDGYVSSWNAGAQRFKGYLPSEIIGKHFSLFHTPEDRAAGVPTNALQTALRTGRFESEGWRVRKDGTRFWASVVIDSIKNDDGELIGFAKVTRDITERKAAQEALRESEERFRLLVQGVTDYAIYMLSKEGEVTNWNAGAERIKGYTHDEVVGRHFSMFYTPEDRAAQKPQYALSTAAATGRFESEGWRVRKDGTQFFAHIVIDSIRNEMGELIGFAKITRDITEKRNAEKALEQASAALFQSQKMEAIGQLTGGVAHDFNNLLAVISSGLDLLSVQTADQRLKGTIDGMQRAISRGATLTQQLLSFARKQPLNAAPNNLTTVIQGFDVVLRRAAHSSIKFAMELDPSVRSVVIDVARFEAALLNLVVNARDAMPNGGTLTIATSNVTLVPGQVGQLAAGEYVRVTVTDNGVGMPPEVRARAFEPFFTTKEIGKGTGLGLSQVYGFIVQSGGEAILHSEVGKGTSISIFLPAILINEMDADNPSDGRTDTSADTGRGPSARAAVEKVLIVEDEPDVLTITAELFRQIGYEPLTAINGDEAVKVLDRSDGIDILFTDVMMPNGMNGVELARYTRGRYPHIKVMLTSGYPLPALNAQHGALDDFVLMNKPYRLAELAKKLRSL